MMVIFSFLPCFGAFLEFINDPTTQGGAVAVIIISLIFTCIWLNMFWVLSGEIGEGEPAEERIEAASKIERVQVQTVEPVVFLQPPHIDEMEMVRIEEDRLA